MGRPLTDRWIGKPHDGKRVLYPIARINGQITRAYILRQIGSDKFLVECATTGQIASCRLTNNEDLPLDGLMCLRFTGITIGYASRISNSKVKDFHGNQLTWSIELDDDTQVHITDTTI